MFLRGIVTKYVLIGLSHMSIFTISFSSRQTGSLCGIFDVQMKTTLSEETFWEMLRRVETRLHFALTYRQQEGHVEEEVFCDTSFRDVLQCIEEIGSLFGEDAVVRLDRNMEFYRQAGMENLYHWDVELAIGAPRIEAGIVQQGAWDFVPLNEETMDAVWGMLREAAVM